MAAVIPENLMQQLENIAQSENRTPADVLSQMIANYPRPVAPGSLAALAQNALEAGLASDEVVDTAERSREILNTEYADYLKKRMEQNSDADSN